MNSMNTNIDKSHNLKNIQDQDVFKSVPSDASLMKDDQISQFCIKILCEFEEVNCSRHDSKFDYH